MARKILIALGVLLAIGVVANLAGGGTTGSSPSPAPTTADVATTEPTVSTSAEPTISESEVPPAPTAEPPLTAAFEDIELTGRGDKVVRFTIPDDQAAIGRFTHNGDSNFAVESIAADGSTNALLVNEIGAYTGNVLFDLDTHSVAFKITADGQWRALIRDITKARDWDPSTRLEGKGADVVQVAPPSSGLVTLRMRHSGESNFAVLAYTSSSSDLLINEIGKYDGEVLLPDGTLLMTVEADGAWIGTPG